MDPSDVVKASKVYGYYVHHRQKNYDMHQNAEYCYKALVLLPNVTFLQVRDCTMQFEWVLLSEAIPQLCSLRILELQRIAQYIGQLPHSTATEINVELSAEIVLGLAQTSVAHKVRTLVTGTKFYLTVRTIQARLFPSTRKYLINTPRPYRNYPPT
jgi:hypothetical protein